jgi:hypothetical protein
MGHVRRLFQETESHASNADGVCKYSSLKHLTAQRMISKKISVETRHNRILRGKQSLFDTPSTPAEVLRYLEYGGFERVGDTTMR